MKTLVQCLSLRQHVSIKKAVIAVIGAAILLTEILEWTIVWRKNRDSNPKDQSKHSFNISRGFIITLNPEESKDIMKQANDFINLPNMTIFKGINGTEAMKASSFNNMVSLYTRYVMVVGRRDHMQLSNPSMLGCLLSHIQVWRQVSPGETVAVFEEDAYFDELSSTRIQGLSTDMRDIEWDILMLESGHIIASGAWAYVGDYAATCASNFTSHYEYLENQNLCTWFGTRGYLITYDGAQKLLQHAFPVHVQIDSLMGLLAAFNPEFRMYWTRENVVHQRIFYLTQVWDACLICYMPRSTLFFCALICVLIWCFVHSLIYTNEIVTRFRNRNHFPCNGDRSTSSS